ncbi:fumarylacetoacetate hydrolase family protein [Pseudonocardia nigra]|uniref:fumarylacetoacetate hydrolase family protein n=1 Tax=Pseudonocardia nigra TaxID=1921578 RepID=UPI001C5D3240|nr:fumarylacetoacetate hydrolase family protein [Pseudonocardia nigra]
MRLATLRTTDGTRAARIEDGTAVELDAPDVGALLADRRWRERVAADGPRHDLAGVERAPVVPRPGKIFCVGLNYGTHILEMGRKLPQFPTLFAKFPEALVGPADPIALDPASVAVRARRRPGRRAHVRRLAGTVLRGAARRRRAPARGPPGPGAAPRDPGRGP